MKKTMITAAVLLLSLITGTEILYPSEGKYVGIVGTVNSSNREVIVNIEGGKSIEIGTKVYVRTGDDIILMEAVFPMMTTVKCRVMRESVKYINSIDKGMNVYRYDKTVTRNKSDIGSGLITVKAGKVRVIGGIEVVGIPGGKFIMGSPEEESGRSADESQHSVTVSSFWIGKYEITQKQYAEIMGTYPSHFKGENLPVEQVSWDEAIEFCNRFGSKYDIECRLPYEAEWEYACRAGTSTTYHWGNAVDESYCWYAVNADNTTHPVGLKMPNSFGLYDMHGNAGEWCMDWYDPAYYSNSPENNPKGPENGNLRILRSGSRASDASYIRAAKRMMFGQQSRSYSVGFRIVILGLK